jgi:hypothetical protein
MKHAENITTMITTQVLNLPVTNTVHTGTKTGGVGR